MVSEILTCMVTCAYDCIFSILILHVEDIFVGAGGGMGSLDSVGKFLNLGKHFLILGKFFFWPDF